MSTFVTNRVFDETTGMRPWRRITANTNATIGDRIYADTIGGPIIVTLPNTVSQFNEITFADLKYTWGVNALTINPGSRKIEGVNEPLVCDAAGLEFTLRYEGEDYGWRIIANTGGGGGGGGGGGLTPTVGGSVMGPAFNAYPGTQMQLVATGGKLIFNTVRFNSGNAYNTATGRFQPNVAGFYQINGTLRTQGVGHTVHTYIIRNGVAVCAGGYSESFTAQPASSVSTIVELNGTTDWVEFNYFVASTVNTFPDIAPTSQSHFSGSLINFTNNYVPVGTVISWADDGPTIPDGWLACNGANVSRTIYSNLFTVIGTRFNATPPANEFTLPDLRGEFVRGWDAGRGIDLNRAFGSRQKGTAVSFNTPNNEPIVHGLMAGSTPDVGPALLQVGADPGNISDYQGTVGSATGASVGVNTGDWMNAYNWGGGVARPRNVALYYLIKY